MSGTSFGNTETSKTPRGLLQYDQITVAEFSGNEFVFVPQELVSCGQSVEQAASVSDW